MRTVSRRRPTSEIANLVRYFAPTLTVAVVLWLALTAAITITGRWS